MLCSTNHRRWFRLRQKTTWTAVQQQERDWVGEGAQGHYMVDSHPNFNMTWTLLSSLSLPPRGFPPPASWAMLRASLKTRRLQHCSRHRPLRGYAAVCASACPCLQNISQQEWNRLVWLPFNHEVTGRSAKKKKKTKNHVIVWWV